MMPNISSDLDLDKQLQNMVQAALAIKKRIPTVALSIEIRQGSQPDPYITFTQPNWYSSHNEFITEICEKFKLDYQLVPQDSKISVVLQRKHIL